MSSEEAASVAEVLASLATLEALAMMSVAAAVMSLATPGERMVSCGTAAARAGMARMKYLNCILLVVGGLLDLVELVRFGDGRASCCLLFVCIVERKRRRRRNSRSYMSVC